jgi:hypothetical protein
VNPATLADRVRGVLGAATPHGAPSTAEPPRPASAADLSTLGGVWEDDCFVVERRVDGAQAHGVETVAAIGERLQEAADAAALVAAGTCARPPFVFFDLETTGLSGGAGTHAFLIGCGWFENTAFVIRQFLLTRFPDERPLLDAVRDVLARAGALVSFNGKSFDAPVLETRYLFHRLRWFGGDVPHVDVLHPARRFWGNGHPALSGQGRAAALVPLGGGSSCSLSALEQQVLGARRRGDVPGSEIPERYFRFVRTGDAAPLAPVLEHNRLDLLSLAGLTARLLHLVRGGPAAARSAREALALGHVYARGGCDARAREAYARAVAACRAPAGAFDGVKIEALRSLAVQCRRAQQYTEAAASWRELLEVRGCPAHIAREATEALAIHHEHRVRDLPAAKMFALRSLETGANVARSDAVRHRLARLERKMSVSEPPRLFPSSPSPTLPPSSGSPTSERRTSS